jgi:cyclomaltodextrinase / maltogenic alpha-amylase / neopullulanase
VNQAKLSGTNKTGKWLERRKSRRLETMFDHLQPPTLLYEIVPDHFEPAASTVPLISIRNRLDHIHALGVDGIVLSPIFPGHDDLRMHPTDFFSIDPKLGNEEDLKELCLAASEKNIAIILMGVFDHVSDQHPWFATACEHGDNEAAYPPDQRTRSFFFFDENEEAGYRCSRGNADEPNLNLRNPRVRRRLFTGEGSVLHHWLHQGVMGWCVLRADSVGYSILREIRRGALTVEGPHVLIGDIRGFADRYVRDGLLDGVVNHYLREAVVAYLQNKIPARQVSRVLRDLARRYETTLSTGWNVLASHAAPRASGILQEWERVRLGVLLTYTLPGAAHILYGDEVGLTCRGSEKTLIPMSWSEDTWRKDVHELYLSLGAVRQQHVALRKGEFVDLTPEGEDEILAFARTTPNPSESVLVIVNRASQTRVRKIFAPVCDLPDGLKLCDVLSGQESVVHSGTITVEVGGQDARILVPDKNDASGEKFFRDY